MGRAASNEHSGTPAISPRGVWSSAEIRATTAVAVLSLIGLVCFASAGWPGAPNYCLLQGDCYCEAPRAGPIAQPASTWSLLGFVVAGFAVAGSAARRGARRETAPNAIGRSSFYPAIYASTIVFLAAGGAFFHASLTNWGGVLDILSMFFWIVFLIAYNLTSIHPYPRPVFGAALVVVSVLLLVPRLLSGEAGVAVFRLVVWVWLASEALVWLTSRFVTSSRLRAVHRDRRWLAASILTNLIALRIWELGHAGSPYCDPGSLVQPHAVWHVLNAVAAGLLYPYLLSERPLEDGTGGGRIAPRPARLEQPEEPDPVGAAEEVLPL